MTTPDTDYLMTSAELAAYFKVDQKAVAGWAKNGKIKVALRTPGGHYRFWHSDVIRLANDSRARENAQPVGSAVE